MDRGFCRDGRRRRPTPSRAGSATSNALRAPHFDAAIVGAGPAGSSLALRLARAGRSVALIERSRFPRTKVCGDYLSPSALAAFDEAGVLDRVEQRAHRLRTISLTGFGLGPVRLKLPGRGALALARSVLDALMLDIALAAGARLHIGAYLSSVEHERRVDVAFRDAEGVERSLTASVLIGADGAWSSVAQHSGLRTTQRTGGRWAVGGHLREQPDGDGDDVAMYLTAEGYYARNPLGGGLVNAMYVMPTAVAPERADVAVAAITNGRYAFDQGRLERKVAIGPLRYQPKRVASGRILLVGDAAGLLDPFTGQGVPMAVSSSRLAEQAVTYMLEGRDPARAARTYAAAHDALVRPRRFAARVIDALLRTRPLRARLFRRVARDVGAAESLLAAVAGADANAKISPKLVLGLLT
ncbi:MAG TPA: FAD-dependent oxidoreductase [Candidatus Tumulicola sp.]|nr:FAD-dependent oxidoreductase [Candidatus Tumulicola sp.]